ncbi:hypothetical protein PENSPDRAFT_690712 [Peniophora sp. CONT]|nr:hypothetical protein PENSPDRAFT_690712 [Peniophora sp. CONT]
MRAGFYIHHDMSIRSQPPLPEMLWGTKDYLNAVYVIDFHPRRARYTRQNTTQVSAPVLLGPVNTAQSVPIFIDRDMSLGGLACTEFVLALPSEVASMRSRLSFGMTEDGVILYGHAGHAHDDGHIQVLASVLPQSNEWGVLSANPQLSLLSQHN